MYFASVLVLFATHSYALRHLLIIKLGLSPSEPSRAPNAFEAFIPQTTPLLSPGGKESALRRAGRTRALKQPAPTCGVPLLICRRATAANPTKHSVGAYSVILCSNQLGMSILNYLILCSFLSWSRTP